MHVAMEHDIGRTAGADPGNQSQHFIGLAARDAVVEQVARCRLALRMLVLLAPSAAQTTMDGATARAGAGRRGDTRHVAQIETTKMCFDVGGERRTLRLAQEVRIGFSPGIEEWRVKADDDECAIGCASGHRRPGKLRLGHALGIRRAADERLFVLSTPIPARQVVRRSYRPRCRHPTRYRASRCDASPSGPHRIGDWPGTW